MKDRESDFKLDVYESNEGEHTDLIRWMRNFLIVIVDERVMHLGESYVDLSIFSATTRSQALQWIYLRLHSSEFI